MIIIRDLTIQYGPRYLFNKINVTFQAKQKIGVVGANGAGKSTLLKVMAGQLQQDEGSISIEQSKTVAYMPQDMVLDSQLSVFDETMHVFDQFLALERECAGIEEQLATNPDNAEKLLDRYTALQDQLTRFDKANALTNATDILRGLGFTDETMQKPVSTLSVGWKMRVVLAKLLLTKADFYFFDEPTNHLDLITKEWFISFLKQGSFGYLLVTHDRYFLNNACNTIFELERGNGTLYYGNLTFYQEQKAERERVLHSQYEQQQRDITRRQETIDRFRASASKAKMAQSMMKQLDKIELIEIPPAPPAIRLSFPPTTRPGAIVLTVDKVSHAFGDRTLFKNVSCEIKRGQKVALVAPNGAGKTTLFNLITGKLPLQSGSVEFGFNVQQTYFEQDQTRVLDAKKTVLQEVSDSCGMIPESTVRAFLGSFLFSGSDVQKKINMLSGGERNRVAMVKVLLQKANMLLLDEPTNHLDMQSQDILLQALKQYDGSILFVSHDHAFVQELATAILELTPTALHLYPGTYEEYLDDKRQREEKNKPATQAPPLNSSEKQNNAAHHEARKQLQKLEKKLEQLERDRLKISEQFASQEYGSLVYRQLQKKLQNVEQEIQNTTAEWEKMSS